MGTYTITETASDSNANTGTASDTFGVDYVVTFTRELIAGKSGQIHFEFNVNRSSTTSDGAFMVDETVAVAIRPASGNKSSSPTAAVYLARNYYGCGDPHGNVHIDTTTGVACTPASSGNTYATDFKRSDWSASNPAAYIADVFFQDVDGNWRYEGSSSTDTF